MHTGIEGLLRLTANSRIGPESAQGQRAFCAVCTKWAMIVSAHPNNQNQPQKPAFLASLFRSRFRDV